MDPKEMLGECESILAELAGVPERDRPAAKEALAKRHERLVREAPLLFEMVCNEACDAAVMRCILHALGSVRGGEQGLEQASVGVGRALVDRYVAPRVQGRR
jgi:hypothetical protein